MVLPIAAPPGRDIEFDDLVSVFSPLQPYSVAIRAIVMIFFMLYPKFLMLKLNVCVVVLELPGLVL